MYIDIDKPQDEVNQLQLSDHMTKYRKFLQSKYRSLELISIDEQLNCSSSKYVDLTLQKIDTQGRTTYKNRKGDIVALSEALDVEGEIKKVIVIKGGPGMGKSTLAINICKCWAEGSLLQTYKAVILLTLRDPEIQAAKNIGDLLLTEGKLKEYVLEEMINCCGEGFCFVLEGYDELPKDLCRASVFKNLKEKLPNSTLVYTSRPEACGKLESVSSRIIEIKGFVDESIDEYISATSVAENLAAELKLKLRQNQIVRELLHIPIYVAIVCLIFFHFSKLPETLTELYTLLCLRLIFRHINTRTANLTGVEELCSFEDLPEDIAEQFSQLCYIAYKGTQSDKIIFSTKDLQSIGIVQRELSDLGLLVTAPSTSVYGTQKSYNFLHKTLQEFCTARYISKLSLQDQLKCINTHWHDKNYEMIWKFYSGITGLKDKEILNCILPYKMVHSRLFEEKMRNLMYCAYEAHNVESCQIIGDHFDGKIDHEYHTSYVRDFFLTHYKGALRQIYTPQESLICDGDAFQLLIESLQKRQLKIKCNDSLILHVPLTGDNVSTLIQLLSSQYPISDLKISFFQLSKSHLQLFTCSKTIRVLNISHSHVSPEVAVCFADLKNVSICNLRMAACSLGPTGADKIGEMLYHNKSIVSIDLSNNDIKDAGVERLVHHLMNNNTLRHLNLEGNYITAVGAKHLGELLSTDHPTLTSIELSNNFLGDVGVVLILSSLTVKMEHIGLRRLSTTFYSSFFIGLSLKLVESIGLTIPNDFDMISGCLACSTELKHFFLEIGSNVASHNLLSAIRRCDKFLTLTFDYYVEEWVADIVKLLECSRTLTQLTIRNRKGTPQDILLLAGSFAVNNLVKKFKYVDWNINQGTILNFLKQLKQSSVVEEVILSVSGEVHNDYQFLGNVENCVQQINYTRTTKGVSSLLRVEIGFTNSIIYM